MVARHCVLAGIGYVHVLYRHLVALHRYAFLGFVKMQIIIIALSCADPEIL